MHTKKINFKKKILLPVFSCFLFACFTVTYEDISSDPLYRDVIGSRYQTNIDLLARGVVIDLNNRDHADFYTLMPEPGFSGPEVVDKGFLNKGVVLEVTGVETCKVCFPDRMHYLVRIINDQQTYSSKKIRIKSGFDNYIKEKNRKRVILNPKFYTKINYKEK